MNRRTTLRTTTVLLAAALGLTLAACGGGAGEGTDATATAPESALVIYSGRSESLVSELLADFTEETGIGVSVRYGGTAELAAQILEEGERSPAEVFFSQDAGALEALAAEGALTALPASTTGLVPEAYRSVDDLWVGTSGRARVLLYNDELVPAADVPTSVLELTEPQWKGKVGIAPTNASFQTFVTAMRVTLGEEATQAWLDGLVANDVQTYDNNVAIRDAVDAGQISLGLANHYYWFEKAAEVGADELAVQNRFLEPGDVGSFVNVAGVAVLAAGAQDPAAQQFVEFLLSEKAQTYFAETTYEYPLVDGVAPAEGLPALSELQGPEINLADLADLAGTQTALQDAGLL